LIFKIILVRTILFKIVPQSVFLFTPNVGGSQKGCHAIYVVIIHESLQFGVCCNNINKLVVDRVKDSLEILILHFRSVPRVCTVLI
jgi:hypothetical protein